MNRRIFLTWIGLGLLASTSPLAIAALIDQNKNNLESNSLSKSFKPLRFYVAPNGNDNWSGQRKRPSFAQKDGPFATLHRVRDAIRELKQQQGGTLQQPVTVFLRDGTYFLSEPLIFTPEDSGTPDFPITYRAYRKEKPVISGGRRITNWKQQGNLWVANLPEVETGKWYFRLLRVGNDWAIRARYPKFDPNNPFTGGWLFAQKHNSTIPDLKFGKDYIAIAPEHFPNWQNWEGAEIHAFMNKNYGNSIFQVSRVDKENHILFGNFTKGYYPIGLGNRFFIDNVREALQIPGEWYLDPKTGEILYWSKVSGFPNNVEVVAPVMDRLIVLRGDSQKESFVEHIQFEGLTFKDTDYTMTDDFLSSRDTAIWLLTARKCVIKDCTFMTLGGYGVLLEQRSHENRIIGNKMRQLGAGGIKLGGKNIATQPFKNLIAANEIHDCGQVYKSVAGISVSTGSGNHIAHNRIYRMPRFGIAIGSVNINNYSHNNIIEFNEIVDTNLETSDTSAIYTLGRDRQLSGNIIRFNFIRNVVGMGTKDNGEIVSPYYTWGIYLDDYSSGTTVYGNIVIGTVLGAVCIHAGKDNLVENNIFIDGSQIQIRLQPRDDFMTGNIFSRNIVVYKNPEALLWYSYKNTWKPDRLKKCDRNLYWHTGGLNLEKTQRAITPEGNFSQWQAAGFDLHSLITEPPFLTPIKQDIDQITKEDFKLDPNSDVIRQIGLKQIPIQRIGIQGFQS